VVAVTTAVVVLFWALWWASDPRWSKPDPSFVVRWLPLAIWISAVTYSAFLGLTIPNDNHVRSCAFFLIMESFVFGMWGVFGIDGRYGVDYQGYSGHPVEVQANYC
jgi:hypothetical protein